MIHLLACCIPLSDLWYTETQHFVCSNGHYGAIGDLGDVSWYSDVKFLYYDVSKRQCDVTVPPNVTQATNNHIVTSF